jgi:hypothetical protein
MEQSLLPRNQVNQAHNIEMDDYHNASSSTLTPSRTFNLPLLGSESQINMNRKGDWRKYILPGLTLLFVFAPGILIIISDDIRHGIMQFGRYLSKLRPNFATTLAFWCIGFFISLLA